MLFTAADTRVGLIKNEMLSTLSNVPYQQSSCRQEMNKSRRTERPIGTVGYFSAARPSLRCSSRILQQDLYSVKNHISKWQIYHTAIVTAIFLLFKLQLTVGLAKFTLYRNHENAHRCKNNHQFYDHSALKNFNP